MHRYVPCSLIFKKPMMYWFTIISKRYVLVKLLPNVRMLYHNSLVEGYSWEQIWRNVITCVHQWMSLAFSS